jgi:four helix bundle protein
MHKYSFEKLEVWQLSRKLVQMIYQITKNYPDNEKFGLTPQMRRSVISVVSNLAEGSSRTSAKDKAHFSQLAFSSLMELLSQLIISCDLNYIKEEKLNEIKLHINEIANKLNALRKSQLTKFQ